MMDVLLGLFAVLLIFAVLALLIRGAVKFERVFYERVAEYDFSNSVEKYVRDQDVRN